MKKQRRSFDQLGLYVIAAILSLLPWIRVSGNSILGNISSNPLEILIAIFLAAMCITINIFSIRFEHLAKLELVINIIAIIYAVIILNKFLNSVSLVSVNIGAGFIAYVVCIGTCGVINLTKIYNTRR